MYIKEILDPIVTRSMKTKQIFISADHGMAIAGLKPHAQSLEALWAEERVGF